MSHFDKNRSGKTVTTDVIVIGAGHAGLAMSYLLNQQGIRHVVLERGEVANSWRHERWDSLKLLTPNWQTRLPGHRYSGDDPDGYMSMPELMEFLSDYAKSADLPVHTHTEVLLVQREGWDYRVRTSRGTWLAKSVVIASGACNVASVPSFAHDVPQDITQLTTHQYRSPGQLAEGGVLIVGASATGVQLADEIFQAGHKVTLAVGEHVRMPRTYRGRDILYWMDRCGILAERYDEVEDLVRGRSLPSSQLVGSHEKRTLDLNCLRDAGVRLTGRLMGVRNGMAQFSGSLPNVCALADLKMKRLLKVIDDYIEDDRQVPAADRFEPTRVDDSPVLNMDLKDTSIKTVIWATGFRPDYSWLDVSVLDRKGRIKHDGGVVDSPGLYALGLPLMRRRKSSFIFGIEDDARDICEHLSRYLNSISRSHSNELYQNNSGRTGIQKIA